MNIHNLYEILNEYFQKINLVSDFDNIIRCEKKYKEVPYEVYYFDFSNSFLKEDFDLDTYLDKLLTNDYYSNPSYLQWNYYLVFLYESNSNIEEKSKKIEMDENFARKFVINSNELDKWLEDRCNINNSYEDTLKDQDLSIIWINKLRENDLDCVYLDKFAYDDGINSYISGKPIKEPEDIENSDKFESKEEKVSRIKKLFLTSYRKSPTRKDFDFGRVNLFVGKNGVGKTSLLEAIELFTCGRNFRNPEEETYKSISIKVLYEDETDFKEIELKNNNKYRMRDYFWYHNYYKKDNKLHLSFNRFNFYNTDAAKQLSDNNNNSPESLKDALNSIALGVNVNILEQRMEKYKKKFESKTKEYNKRISENRKIIEREKLTIEEIFAQNKNPELLYNEFIKETQNVNWIGVLPNHYDDDLANFETELVKIRHNLKTVLDEIDWMKNLTIKSLYFEMKNLEKIQQKNKSISQKINEINYENNTLNQKYTKLNDKITLLKKLENYYQNEEIGQLIGLDERISKLKMKKSNYDEAINSFELINMERHISCYGNITIDELTERLEKKIIDTESRKLSIENEISEVEKSLSNIENIIYEIKSKGKELILIHPNIQTCPLCNSLFEKDELKIRIESTIYETSKLEISKTIEYTLKENLKLAEEIGISKQDHKNLQNGKNLMNSLIKMPEFSSYRLLDVRSLLEVFRQQRLVDNNKLNDLVSLKRRLNSNGLYEEDFNYIIREIRETEHEGLNSSNITLQDLYIEIQKKEQQYIEIRSKLFINNSEMEKQKLLIKEIADNISASVKADNLEVIINIRARAIKLSFSLLMDASKVLKISEDFPINELKNKMDLLYEVFNNFKNEKIEKDRNNIAIEISQSKITELSELISNLEREKEVSMKGFSIIEEILGQNNKDVHLDDFLTANKQEIYRIFSMIHSPKEFKNFDFNSLGIFLERNDSEIATLSKISTGQRSALALSIFLTLNKKLKKGPEYIIFDDPIAYVDDLNALSFFDYLREIVVNTERQIFFATANENLAFLFYQKFNFLDESQFKTYILN